MPSRFPAAPARLRVGPGGAPRLRILADPTTYQGPEYRGAVAPTAPLPPLLHPDPQHPPRLQRWVLALLAWWVPRLFRFRVEGGEHIPPPPFIVASNHQRWFDPLFIVLAFPRVPMVYSMAKRETVFNRAWKRWLVVRFGVFPISPSRGELDPEGLAAVYQVLARGGVVLIFPEGRYSRGRALRPLKKGVAHFSLQAGVPICPVAVSGLDRLRPGGRVTVAIGPPIHPTPPLWWSTQVRVAALLEELRLAILGMFSGGREATGGRARRRWVGRLSRFLPGRAGAADPT